MIDMFMNSRWSEYTKGRVHISYRHWSENVMKNVVNSIMTGYVSIRAASGLFRFPDSTLQKCATAVHLQQKLQNYTTGVKLNTTSNRQAVLSNVEEKYLCGRLKDLAEKCFGCIQYQVRLCRETRSKTSIGK